MSNEAARAALRERAETPLALVKTPLVLGGVEVYVRALPFRQAMKLRRDHPDTDLPEDQRDDIAQARVVVRALFDSAGELLLDPLSDDDLQIILDQKHSDFWLAVSAALVESEGPGKASTQTTSS